MTRTTAVLAVVLVVLLALAAMPVKADEPTSTPTISVGTVKPIAPDLTLELGLSASWQCWTPPAEWVLVGGRALWIDALYLDKHGFFGASMDCFDRTRIGFTAFKVGADSGTDWSVYLVTPLVSW